MVFSAKVSLLFLLYLMSWGFCLWHLIRQICLKISFLIVLTLMAQLFLKLLPVLHESETTYQICNFQDSLAGHTCYSCKASISVCKIFKKILNNSLVDHFKKCCLFLIIVISYLPTSWGGGSVTHLLIIV